MNKVPMTAEGYKNLQNELKQHINNDRPKIISAITEARSHGDLSENAEYQCAKEQQSLIEGKILELEATIALAEIIDVSQLTGDEIKDLIFKDIHPKKVKDEGNEESGESSVLGSLGLKPKPAV